LRSSSLAVQQPFPAEARLDSALQAGRLGYWELDAARQLTSSGQHDRNFGRSGSPSLGYADLLSAIHTDEREQFRRLLDTCLSAGTPIDLEARVIWPDGSLHWLRLGAQRITDEPDRPPRLVGISFDITDRKHIEQHLRDERATLATLYRVGKLLAGELDLKRVVQTVTDAATELSGAQFGAFFYNVLDGKGGSSTLCAISGVPPEAFSTFASGTEAFASSFASGIVRSADIRKDERYGKNAPHFGMPDGHLPVASYLAVPVISRSGAVLGRLFFGHERPDVFTERAERIAAGIASQAAIAIDNAQLYQSAQNEITERRRAEQQQKLLTAELNHRVRNTLAIVLAIANQTLRHADSAARFRQQFEQRVTALSEAHNLLTESAWEGAALRDILERVLRPYAVPDRARYELTGPDVRIGPKYAVSLLMAFHELATNAAKYGALSNDEGRITVTWAPTELPKPPGLTIVWRESGGPPVKPRRRRGFGSRLIDGLTAETNGDVSLEFNREGVACTIGVPMPPGGDGVVQVGGERPQSAPSTA
jgi:two-component sensor histidine kinase